MPPKKDPAGEPQFSESDRQALDHARDELQDHKHRQWLWGMLGRGAKWLLAVIAGVTVVADAVLRLMKALGKG